MKTHHCKQALTEAKQKIGIKVKTHTKLKKKKILYSTIQVTWMHSWTH